MTDNSADKLVLFPKLPFTGSIDWRRATTLYDAVSDTLFIDFYGDSRPAVSVPFNTGPDDFTYARIDVNSREVVGVQLEHYVSRTIHRHPVLALALGLAELVGMTRKQALAIRRQVLPNPDGREGIDVVVDELSHLVA